MTEQELKRARIIAAQAERQAANPPPVAKPKRRSAASLLPAAKRFSPFGSRGTSGTKR